MTSLSQVERAPRLQGAAKVVVDFGARLRRAIWRDRSKRPSRARPAGSRWADWLAPVRRTLERALSIGVDPALPIGTQKRIRLCNAMALGGAIIMAVWAYVEASFGDRHTLPWEVGFTATFLAVLVLNGSGAHRTARLLLVVN